MSQEEKLLAQERKMAKSVIEHSHGLLESLMKKLDNGIDLAKDKNCLAIVLHDEVFKNKPLPKSVREGVVNDLKGTVVYVELASDGTSGLYPCIVFNHATKEAITSLKANLFEIRFQDNFSKLYE